LRRMVGKPKGDFGGKISDLGFKEKEEIKSCL
jgi:hypothetical protein